MSALSAYSFPVFNLLCAPCFAAMGAIKREMNNAKWFWFAIGYQTALAYVVSLCIYRIGTFITERAVNMGTIVTGGVLLGVVGWIICGMIMNKKKGRSLHCGGCCKDCSRQC